MPEGHEVVAGATPPVSEGFIPDPEGAAVSTGYISQVESLVRTVRLSGSGSLTTYRGRCPRLLTSSLSGTRRTGFECLPNFVFILNHVRMKQQLWKKESYWFSAWAAWITKLP
jgi:hypothetical protein